MQSYREAPFISHRGNRKTNYCMFAFLGKCVETNTEVLGIHIICSKHSSLIFGLTQAVFSTNTLTGEHETRKALVFTRQYNTSLPFPYNFKYETNGKLNTKLKPCLDEQKLSNQYESYIQSSFAPNTNEHTYERTLILLRIVKMLHQHVPTSEPEVQEAFGRMLSYFTAEFKAYVRGRYEHSYILVNYFNTISLGNEQVLYPMAQMPYIYKMLFTATEMSTIEDPNNPNTAKQLQPIYILDAVKSKFVVQKSEMRDIYILPTEPNMGHTVLTPIVIAGKDKVDHNSLFKRMYNAMEYALPIPESCNTTYANSLYYDC